ncbi:hypothetical protein EJB05_46713, partial [Eragrostis curvula]
CTVEQRDLVKLLLWRAWTVHNNIAYQSGPYSIQGSVIFLLNLRESLFNIRQQTGESNMSLKQKSWLPWKDYAWQLTGQEGR